MPTDPTPAPPYPSLCFAETQPEGGAPPPPPPPAPPAPATPPPVPPTALEDDAPPTAPAAGPVESGGLGTPAGLALTGLALLGAAGLAALAGVALGALALLTGAPPAEPAPTPAAPPPPPARVDPAPDDGAIVGFAVSDPALGGGLKVWDAGRAAEARFRGGAAAWVDRTLVDVLPPDPDDAPGVADAPAAVRVEARADAVPGAPWLPIAVLPLPKAPGRYVVAHPAFRTRGLRVRVLGPVVARVRAVLEACDRPSILADVAHDLAAPALGGHVVAVGDGEGLPAGWTVGFRRGRAALVSAVHVEGTSARYAPRRVEVLATCHGDPSRGRRVVARATLPPKGGRIALGWVAARYVTVRALEGHGSEVRLERPRVFERVGGGYRSILGGWGIPAPSLPATGRRAASLEPAPGDAAEVEPNDGRGEAQALRLGRPVAGVLGGRRDRDLFAVEVPDALVGRPARLVLEGCPTVAFRARVYGARGVVATFDPTDRDAAVARVERQWTVAHGRVLVEVCPASPAVVLLYDLSPSVERVVPALRRALPAWAVGLEEGERAGIASFVGVRGEQATRVVAPLHSDRVEVLAGLTEPGAFEVHPGTPLFDALVDVSGLLARSGAARRAVVVISDGADTSSEHDRSEALAALTAAGVAVHAIGVGELHHLVEDGGTGEETLRLLARATGGRFELGLGSLRRAVDRVAGEVRAPARYRLRVEAAAPAR